MELNGFHIAERNDAGIEGDDVTAAIADDRVRGGAVDAAVAAGGDERGLGEIADEFAGAQVTGDAAHALIAVVDEGFGLHSVMHGNAELDGPVIEGVQHFVSGAVRRVAGTPFGRTAKGAGMNKPIVLGLFRSLEEFAALEVGMFAGNDAVPGAAEEGHFAHGDGGRFREDAGHFLVAAPVGALDRVVEVDFRAVTVTHDGVAESSLHAALGAAGMRTPRGNDAQADDVESGLGRLDGDAFTGQTGAYAQNVCVKETHIFAPPTRWTRCGL